MKSIRQTLKEIFAPAAAALSALALAVPLAMAPAPAEAAVMNTGPTPLVLRQLKTDGYTPVGGGQIQGQDGRTQVVAIFRNPNNEWIATQGTQGTTQVVARGTDLQIRQWAYSINVSLGPDPVVIDHEGQGAASQCMPFEQVRENVLKSSFQQADLIQGRLQNGDTMQMYVNNGEWLSVTVKPDADRTTCRMAQGSGFRMAAPPAQATVN